MWLPTVSHRAASGARQWIFGLILSLKATGTTTTFRLQPLLLSPTSIPPRWTMLSSWLNKTGKIAGKRWILSASSSSLLAQPLPSPSSTIRRTFSSTNTSASVSKAKPANANDVASTSNKTTNGEDEEEIVLFHRNPVDTSRTLFVLRSGCLFSTFHTGYWMWYNTDFIPLVNQSPIPELHIDPLLGIGGLTFAALLQIAVFLYPSRLLSAITIRPATKELVIYAHRFPLLRPSLSPSRRFVIPPTDHDTERFAPLTLSPTDISTLQDVGFATYRGLLMLGTKWPRYIMDIQNAKDIVAAPDVMWDALVQPAVLFGHGRSSREDYDDDNTEDDSPTSWKRRRRRVVRKGSKKWQRKRK